MELMRYLGIKMLVTELFDGQGLGNQLWCYFTTRCIAYNNNYSFGIKNKNLFKGQEFLELDFGEDVENRNYDIYHEKVTRHPSNNLDISKYDDDLADIQDNTCIIGNMQSIYYVLSLKEKIRSWIKIKEDYNITTYDNPNICIIHIRGGDFLGSSAFLLSDYYHNSMQYMLQKNPKMQFLIVTDDKSYAQSIVPNVEIVGSSSSNIQDSFKASHHIGGPIWMDWTILFNARNVILSASSFSWWPVWLNRKVNVIAPMFWADYKNSDGYWSCGDSLIPGWEYLNRNGKLYNYYSCYKSKTIYEIENKLYGYK
jgi:hypothetical protein